MTHFCSSKGKNSTLMEQEERKMADESHVTFPSEVTMMLVLRMALLY